MITKQTTYPCNQVEMVQASPSTSWKDYHMCFQILEDESVRDHGSNSHDELMKAFQDAKCPPDEQ